MKYIVAGYIPEPLISEFPNTGRTRIRLVCKSRAEAEEVLEDRKWRYKELHIIEEPTDILVIPTKE